MNRTPDHRRRDCELQIRDTSRNSLNRGLPVTDKGHSAWQKIVPPASEAGDEASPFKVSLRSVYREWSRMVLAA
jgi:hypothetical protein